MHEKIIIEKRGAAVNVEHIDHTTALRALSTDENRRQTTITMVCPMRFVLVGFSVVVATLGFFMYSGGPEIAVARVKSRILVELPTKRIYH